MENIQTKVDVLEGPDAVRYAEDVHRLYLEAGWMTPDEPAAILPDLIRNTRWIACAVNADGHLVGMMRALSDGVSDAYLLDMTVLPEYRRKGLATEILNALLDHLQKKGIDWIVSVSVPGVEKLYLRRGKLMAGHTPMRFL